jgi:hypothetical protein
MKNTLLFILTVLTSIKVANAQQLANPGFENWDTIGDYTQPSNWYSLNPLAQFGFEPSTTLTDDAHTGNYAVVLTSIAGQFTNYSGVLCTGPILDQNLQPDFSNMKVAFTARPSHIRFYYKAFPVGGDSGAFAICLTRWNTTLGQADTIAEASVLFGEQVNVYTLAELAFKYRNSAAPDSMFVIAASSFDGFNPTPESKLQFDDFELVYQPTGVSNGEPKWNVDVYPNPATSELFVETSNKPISLVITDANGKICMQQTYATKHHIKMESWSAGLYLLMLTDEEGVIETRKIMFNN